jgi:RNA polymerase sigma-70 factor (ECF subfamily)
MSFADDLPAELLAAARRAERRAQAQIYQTFERPVYNLIRRMVNDPQAAEDLSQDTFLRAFRTLHQFRGEAPFGAWLRTIAATEALMHLRRRRREAEFFVSGMELDGPGMEDISDADLENALCLLPTVPRSVLWLYHVEGYTHVEIAEMAGKTVSFSKSQLSRAHQKLRALLKIEGAQAASRTEPETPPCSNSSSPPCPEVTS